MFKHILQNSIKYILLFALIFFQNKISFAIQVQLSQKANTDSTFFNGENLKGWNANDMSIWSVKNGAIVGHTNHAIAENEFIWSEVAVRDFYLNIDVKLKPNNRNAGIQFRSEKINERGQALGYQADVGLGWWGKLYHEHGRGPLDFTNRGEEAVKKNQWNQYEILAIGDRIWTAINGVLSASVEDPGGERSGKIALQVHSGPSQTVHYRVNKLVHNPELKLAGYTQEELMKSLKSPLVPPPAELSFNNNQNNLLFAGGANIQNMNKFGYVYKLFSSSFPGKKLHFKNIGWAGNTVYNQLHDSSLAELDKKNADIIFLQFGQMEALEGEENLSNFIGAYKELLLKVNSSDRQIVLVSPIPFGSPGLKKFNDDVQSYSLAIREIADAEGCIYLDLYQHMRVYGDNISNLTTDGIHLNSKGHHLITTLFARGLNMDKGVID